MEDQSEKIYLQALQKKNLYYSIPWRSEVSDYRHMVSIIILQVLFVMVYCGFFTLVFMDQKIANALDAVNSSESMISTSTLILFLIVMLHHTLLLGQALYSSAITNEQQIYIERTLNNVPLWLQPIQRIMMKYKTLLLENHYFWLSNMQMIALSVMNHYFIAEMVGLNYGTLALITLSGLASCNGLMMHLTNSKDPNALNGIRPIRFQHLIIEALMMILVFGFEIVLLKDQLRGDVWITVYIFILMEWICRWGQFFICTAYWLHLDERFRITPFFKNVYEDWVKRNIELFKQKKKSDDIDPKLFEWECSPLVIEFLLVTCNLLRLMFGFTMLFIFAAIRTKYISAA